MREKGEKTADFWHKKLQQSAIQIGIETIIKAMKFKFENKTKNLSFIDCAGYVIANENRLIFLTGDKGFEDVSDVEFVR